MLTITDFSKPQNPYPQDVLEILLSERRSKNTQKAYLGDLRIFFSFIAADEPLTAALVARFLQLKREQAVILVLRFKAHCLEKKLAEATLNRRLAAIRALVSMGQTVGACSYNLDDIKGEKVQSYRDTTGVEVSTFTQCLAKCDLNTPKGKRDYALLHLLWSNGLRRGEVASLKIKDLDLDSKRLRIYGKGLGTQALWIDLSQATTSAIERWLLTRELLTEQSPIFSSLHAGYKDYPLTTTGIYKIVEQYFKLVTSKHISPHRIRHSAITAALDLYNGDVRKVQKFSRHKSIETLMIYDDNRQNSQKQISRSLSDLLG